MSEGLAMVTLEEEETQKAVQSIIIDHDYLNKTAKDNNEGKRKRDNDPCSPTDQIENTPELKKIFTKRYYKYDNQGPYEIIIQDKDKQYVETAGRTFIQRNARPP
ncbi:hypothetical protein J6590_088903 [Homalodisca vitripennis]|nr:hypothetical protein J6590_088903 [Homalodisca vitripennis]